MKLSPLIALTGLALATVSSPSFAGCSPACTGGDICRYEAAGNYFYCAAPKSVRSPGTRGPTAPGGAAGSASMKATPASGATARTGGPGPKAGQSYSFGATQTGSFAKAGGAPRQSIQSPRDVASGQATGKRQHKP